MSKPQPARALTPSEERVVDLVKVFDKAAEDRKNVVILMGSKEATEMIGKLELQGRIKTLKVEWDTKQAKYAIAFSMQEFYRYLKFVLKQTGLTLRPDGSLKTYDNYTISSEYTQ